MDSKAKSVPHYSSLALDIFKSSSSSCVDSKAKLSDSRLALDIFKSSRRKKVYTTAKAESMCVYVEDTDVEVKTEPVGQDPLACDEAFDTKDKTEVMECDEDTKDNIELDVKIEVMQEEEITYQCHVCSLIFNAKTSMEDHVVKMHPGLVLWPAQEVI